MALALLEWHKQAKRILALFQANPSCQTHAIAFMLIKKALPVMIKRLIATFMAISILILASYVAKTELEASLAYLMSLLKSRGSRHSTRNLRTTAVI